MAFIRNVIILGAVVALLPTDQNQQSRFYDSAVSAVTWTATFCDRNGALCAEGQAMWATFAKKAEFGAGVAYSLVQQHLQPSAQTAGPPQPVSAERGTLRPDDMRPNWRVPVQPSRPGI